MLWISITQKKASENSSVNPSQQKTTSSMSDQLWIHISCRNLIIFLSKSLLNGIDIIVFLLFFCFFPLKVRYRVGQRSQTRGPPEVLVRPATSFINRKNADLLFRLSHFQGNLPYFLSLGFTMRPAEPIFFSMRPVYSFESETPGVGHSTSFLWVKSILVKSSLIPLTKKILRWGLWCQQCQN